MSKKYVYIIIGIVALLVTVILFFPSVPKSFLKGLIKTYEVEFEQKKRELDSIKSLRERDSIAYLEALKIKDFELGEIQQRLDRANYKIKQNENELNSYRNGDFNERFGKFTSLITDKDSL